MSLSTDASSLVFLAESAPGGLTLIWDFLQTGGFVMALIVACSFASVAAMIIVGLNLRVDRLLPAEVVKNLKDIPDYATRGDIAPLQRYLQDEGSLLSRMALLIVNGLHTNRQECQEACAIRAREEIHQLEIGIPLLEMMVTVAPLLGLLGTTVGLVGMFSAFGEGGAAGPDTADVAREIGVALRCTIAGLLVAVPSVLAHTFFTRKLDSIAGRLEFLLHETIYSFFQHFEVQRGPAER